MVAVVQCGALRSAAAHAMHRAGRCRSTPRCAVRCCGGVTWPPCCPHPSIAMRRAAEAGHGCACQARGGCSRQRAGKRAFFAGAGGGGCLAQLCRRTTSWHAQQTQNLCSHRLGACVSTPAFHASWSLQDEMRKRAEERRMAKLQEEQARHGHGHGHGLAVGVQLLRTASHLPSSGSSQRTHALGIRSTQPAPCTSPPMAAAVRLPPCRSACASCRRSSGRRSWQSGRSCR